MLRIGEMSHKLLSLCHTKLAKRNFSLLGFALKVEIEMFNWLVFYELEKFAFFDQRQFIQTLHEVEIPFEWWNW